MTNKRNAPLTLTVLLVMLAGLVLPALFPGAAGHLALQSTGTVWSHPYSLLTFALVQNGLLRWASTGAGIAATGLFLEPRLGWRRLAALLLIAPPVAGLSFIFLANGPMLVGSGVLLWAFVGAAAARGVREWSTLVSHQRFGVALCVLGVLAALRGPFVTANPAVDIPMALAVLMGLAAGAIPTTPASTPPGAAT